jgi:hypothetical protein
MKAKRKNSKKLLKAKNKMKANTETIDGVPFRQVAQIVRRKMMSKTHKTIKTYSRKDKSWKNI